MAKLFGWRVFIGGRKDWSQGVCEKVFCHLTPALLLLLAAILVGLFFLSSPISCWCPEHFTASHVQYTETVCLRKQFFHIPFNEMELFGERSVMVPTFYYQIPLLLCLGAFFVVLPHISWHALVAVFRLPVAKITDAEEDWTKCSLPESRANITAITANLLAPGLTDSPGSNPMGLDSIIRLLNQLKTIAFYPLYLLSNAIIALNLLIFLEKSLCYGNSCFYGLRFLGLVKYEGNYTIPNQFPEKVFCDFDIRRLGTQHNYSVQCALSINVWNSTALLLVWCWFMAVTVMNSCRLAHIMLTIFSTALDLLNPLRPILVSAIRAKGDQGPIDERAVKAFFGNNGLCFGGSFVLAMTSSNMNDAFATDVCYQAWTAFKKKGEQAPRAREVPPNQNLQTTPC